MSTPNFMANGTISTSVFVAIDPTTSNKVIQATAGASVIGISAEYPNAAPLPGSNSTIAATVGQSIAIYGLGDTCLLLAGSGGWTAGDYLKTGTGGIGVTAHQGDDYGAVALTTITSAVLGPVQVVLGRSSPASSN